MEFKEITAKTVDEAITKACLEFETSSDNLEIQVVQEGTSGFLGFIGSKPAVIKVRKKVQEEEFDILKELAKEEKKEKKAPVKEEKKEPKKEFKKEVKKEAKPVREPKKETAAKPQTENKEVKPVAKEAQPKPEPRKPVVRTEEQVQQMKQDAEKFLTGVFGAMELPVEITMNYDKTADCLEIDFAGEDMGILIGKRGQTLDSLQYLTSLVVNKEQQDYVRVKVDTENYRSRRKDTLENLAKNIVEVLYPADEHYAGKELRLKQQYFFISASVQEAVAKYKKNHSDIRKFYEKATFQLNDTHPTVAVAELMRILMDEEGLEWDEACVKRPSSIT